jgi:hypothetical protein
VVVVATASCLSDYDLEERRFRCDPSATSSCGAGWTCGADGFCARSGSTADATAADGAIVEICDNGVDDDGDQARDCADSECGAASCDDDNPCTTEDACLADGTCRRTPLTGSCGMGCTCTSGVARETACVDDTDNDGDGKKDCLDDDCPCGTGSCCPAGFCAAMCPP